MHNIQTHLYIHIYIKIGTNNSLINVIVQCVFIFFLLSFRFLLPGKQVSSNKTTFLELATHKEVAKNLDND